MFSLIIVIISIALVALLALATIYYGGTAYSNYKASAEASALTNQASQLYAASLIYKQSVGTWPATPNVLLNTLPDGSQPLNALPVPPQGTLAMNFVREAIAQTTQNWEFVLDGNGILTYITLPEYVRPETCVLVNDKASGADSLLGQTYEQRVATIKNNLTEYVTTGGTLKEEYSRFVQVAEGGVNQLSDADRTKLASLATIPAKIDPSKVFQCANEGITKVGGSTAYTYFWLAPTGGDKCGTAMGGYNTANSSAVGCGAVTPTNGVVTLDENQCPAGQLKQGTICLCEETGQAPVQNNCLPIEGDIVPDKPWVWQYTVDYVPLSFTNGLSSEGWQVAGALASGTTGGAVFTVETIWDGSTTSLRFDGHYIGTSHMSQGKVWVSLKQGGFTQSSTLELSPYNGTACPGVTILTTGTWFGDVCTNIPLIPAEGGVCPSAEDELVIYDSMCAVGSYQLTGSPEIRRTVVVPIEEEVYINELSSNTYQEDSDLIVTLGGGGFKPGVQYTYWFSRALPWDTLSPAYPVTPLVATSNGSHVQLAIPRSHNLAWADPTVNLWVSARGTNYGLGGTTGGESTKSIPIQNVGTTPPASAYPALDCSQIQGRIDNEPFIRNPSVLEQGLRSGFLSRNALSLFKMGASVQEDKALSGNAIKISFVSLIGQQFDPANTVITGKRILSYPVFPGNLYDDSTPKQESILRSELNPSGEGTSEVSVSLQDFFDPWTGPMADTTQIVFSLQVGGNSLCQAQIAFYVLDTDTLDVVEGNDCLGWTGGASVQMPSTLSLYTTGSDYCSGSSIAASCSSGAGVSTPQCSMTGADRHCQVPAYKGYSWTGQPVPVLATKDDLPLNSPFWKVAGNTTECTN